MSKLTIGGVMGFAQSWLPEHHPDIEWDVQFYDGCLVITGQRLPNLNRVRDMNPWQDIESAANLEDLIRQSAYAVMDMLENFPSPTRGRRTAVLVN